MGEDDEETMMMGTASMRPILEGHRRLDAEIVAELDTAVRRLRMLSSGCFRTVLRSIGEGEATNLRLLSTLDEEFALVCRAPWT